MKGCFRQALAILFFVKLKLARPMSALVQAALFAAGAVVGGGVTAAVFTKRQAQRPVIAPTVDGTIVSPAVATVSPPVIGLGANGNAQISSLASATSLSSSAVLKYGNPGECILHMIAFLH